MGMGNGEAQRIGGIGARQPGQMQHVLHHGLNLRLGGTVGQGAWVDHAFNTTDVCLIVDIGRMSPRHRAFYTRKQDGTE